MIILRGSFRGLLVLSGVKCFNKLFTCRVCKWINFHEHSNIFVKPLLIHEVITQSHARIKATCSVWISKHACKNHIQTRIFANQSGKQHRILKNSFTDYYFQAVKVVFFFPNFSIPPTLFLNCIVSVISFPKGKNSDHPSHLQLLVQCL